MKKAIVLLLFICILSSLFLQGCLKVEEKVVVDDGDRPENGEINKNNILETDQTPVAPPIIIAPEEPDDDPSADGTPRFTLSTRGKNVVILFLDRMLGEVVPSVMKEFPELMEKFDGFTYYSNVVAYGGHTNFGAPPMFGGYEYTPVEMNRRYWDRLVDKHNESLKVLPVLFLNNEFNVTVFDMPYGNYKWDSDLSIYNDFPKIRKFKTAGCFRYTTGVDFSGQSADFQNNYESLYNLSTMTVAKNNSKNNFVIYCNDLPHQISYFDEPEYIPTLYPDNYEYDAAHADRFVLDDYTINCTGATRVKHYQTNVASFLMIGRWLDTLKALGVYDNTRIILVSDHGYYLHQIEKLDFPDHMLTYGENVYGGNYFPVLMVKDFGAKGYTTSDEFMTTADVPTIAVEGIISNPTNPFTGKLINSDEKTAHDQLIVTNHDGWSTDTNNGYTFDAGTWAAVTNNIWDRDDWKFIDDWVVLTEHYIN